MKLALPSWSQIPHWLKLTGAGAAILAVSYVPGDPPGDNVYVCNSSTAFAYHNTDDCRALARCTHRVAKWSISRAERRGRRPCHVCF